MSLFNLCKQLLTPQQHYDWGLRALKTILKGCGSLLQSTPKKASDGEPVNESRLIVQALRLNTLPKLAFGDSRRFDALVSDVFPGVQLQSITFEHLQEALTVAASDIGIVMNDTVVGYSFNYSSNILNLLLRVKLNCWHGGCFCIKMRKAFELFEQLRQRMGCVIVGPSGSGKSTLWRLLRAGLQKTGQQVNLYTMNPKSMPRQRVSLKK